MTWKFQNSGFLLYTSGSAPQCTILMLHAAFQLIQDGWPEHRALLVEPSLLMGSSFQHLEDSGSKLNSSVVLISLQPSAAAVSCAFLSACPTWLPAPWVGRLCSALPGALSGTPRLLQAAECRRVSLSLASLTQVTKKQCTSKLLPTVSGSVPLFGYGYIF